MLFHGDSVLSKILINRFNISLFFVHRNQNLLEATRQLDAQQISQTKISRTDRRSHLADQNLTRQKAHRPIKQDAISKE